MPKLDTFNSKAALIWLVACLVAAAWLLSRWAAVPVNASVLALLPVQSQDATAADLERAFTRRLDRQVVWMVSPGTQPDARLAAQWRTRMLALPGVAEVQGPMTPQLQRQWLQFFHTYRNSLLDAQTRARLQAGSDVQAQWVLGQLYSAFAGVGQQELAHDPLMLVRGAQMALMQGAGALSLNDGWLSTRDAQGRFWYFLPAQLQASSFDMSRTRALVAVFRREEAAFLAAHPQASVLSRGSLFYSAHAARQAGHDVTVIGSVTILGVVLLILVAFRSLLPLLLCVLSVGMGALWGTALTVALFGEVHLMTLAMSLSVVGISVDYALYYLVERRARPYEESPWRSMGRVRPALFMALGTSAVAYLLLTLAPFPGIRQLAIFAAAGLCAACLTVVLWHPLLTHSLRAAPVPCLSQLDAWLRLWRTRRLVRVGVPLLLAGLAALALGRLPFSDDIAQLQEPPARIQAQDRRITGLTGQSMDQKWFLIVGRSPQQALERLDAFVPRLARAQAAGWLRSYRALPLHSLQRQVEDQRLLRAAAAGVRQALTAVGLDLPPADTRLVPLEPQAWLASPASQGWRLLWLSLPDGRSAVLVPVAGVSQTTALAALAQPADGIHWIDRKAAFDQLFARYRRMLGGLLILALGVVCAVSVARLGWRRGLRTSVPSLLSLALGLGALTLFGRSANLFSLLALVLVLGIGINYTIFFGNPRGTPRTSLFAVLLAMLTTLLTLGVLVFSSTRAISSFGIVLSVGILTAFLLAPLALPDSDPPVTEPSC
ncbi:MMPL family transporter [Castellaniella caeni]|uniref:MMPL family transporter n=1 Tax=Castellaniella caeni TaxID=266123 RepID=UPI00082E4654|nr:MMPL family transporter [Castellaniella caeni]